MKLFLLIFLISLTAQAEQVDVYPGETKPFPTESSEILPPHTDSKIEQTVDDAEPLPVESTAEVKVEGKVFKKLTTKDLREESIGTLSIGFQYLASWIPFKKVVSYTHIFNSKWSLEAEYSWSSLDVPNFGVDLGEVSEKRYSLLAKRYVGNSFHFDFGPYFYDTKARAGASILGQGVRVSEFGAEGFGASLGMGNRWQWKNGVTFGVDWVRVNVPIKDTLIDNDIRKDVENDEDSKDIKDTIDAFTDLPTFVLLGIKLGYTF